MSSDENPIQFPHVFGLWQPPPDPELVVWFTNLSEENYAEEVSSRLGSECENCGAPIDGECSVSWDSWLCDRCVDDYYRDSVSELEPGDQP